MFFVIVDADRYHLELKPENGRLLSQIGEMLKADAQEKFPVNHPDFDYPGPDILAFTDLMHCCFQSAMYVCRWNIAN